MSNAQVIYTVPEMKALNITERFDEINISSETFYRKPSKRFFQIMIDKLGIAPEQILMVGNHPGDDIQNAHALGIRTCYLNSNQSPADAPPCTDDIYDIFLNYPEGSEAPMEQMPWEILLHIFQAADSRAD